MKQSNIPLPPQIIDCSTQTQNPQSGFKTVSTQFSNTLISNLFPCLQRTMLQTDDHKTSPYTFTKTTLEEKMSPVFNTTSARKHIVCSYIYIYIRTNRLLHANYKTTACLWEALHPSHPIFALVSSTDRRLITSKKK